MCSMLKVTFAIVFVSVLVGCTNAMVFTSSYLAGIEITPAGNNGQQSVKVGLQKFEAVTMPACKTPGSGSSFFEPCQELMPEAYSLISMSDMSTGTLLLGGLTSVQIKQVFATGKAALAPKAADSVRNGFVALETRYAPDEISRCLSAWLDQDTNGSRTRQVKEWWDKHGPTGTNAELMIVGDKYAALRKQFASETGICH